MKDFLLKIIKDGGLFCGGFVRDWLIRGDNFNDIDFYFNGIIPEPYASWEFIGGAKTMVVGGKKFHCGITPYDITCNVFSFDGTRIIARPTYMEYSYTLSWEMIFNKEFVFTNMKDILSAEKMKRRGWKKVGFDFRRRSEPLAPTCGVWSGFELAKQRFDSLT